jgi:hypothetical protein
MFRENTRLKSPFRIPNGNRAEVCGEQACEFVYLEEICLPSFEYRCRRLFAIGSTYEKVLAYKRDDGLPLNRKTRTIVAPLVGWAEGENSPFSPSFARTKCR